MTAMKSKHRNSTGPFLGMKKSVRYNEPSTKRSREVKVEKLTRFVFVSDFYFKTSRIGALKPLPVLLRFLFLYKCKSSWKTGNEKSYVTPWKPSLATLE